MNTRFEISLLIRTPSGFEDYGCFDLGSNQEQAMAIVEQLKGTEDLSESSILYMNFTAINDGIPLPIKVLHCTLDDVTYNTRIITRDMFKNLSL